MMPYLNKKVLIGSTKPASRVMNLLLLLLSIKVAQFLLWSQRRRIKMSYTSNQKLLMFQFVEYLTPLIMLLIPMPTSAICHVEWWSLENLELFVVLIRNLEQDFRYVYAKDSFRNKYTPFNALEDAVVDILTIYSSKHSSLEGFDFPCIGIPQDHNKRVNHWKLYCGIKSTLHEFNVTHKKVWYRYREELHSTCGTWCYFSLVTDFSLDGYKNRQFVW